MGEIHDNKQKWSDFYVCPIKFYDHRDSIRLFHRCFVPKGITENSMNLKDT